MLYTNNMVYIRPLQTPRCENPPPRKRTEYQNLFWAILVSILDMLGYEEMKLPINSQEMAPFGNLLDLSRPWGSLGGIYEER